MIYNRTNAPKVEVSRIYIAKSGSIEGLDPTVIYMQAPMEMYADEILASHYLAKGFEVTVTPFSEMWYMIETDQPIYDELLVPLFGSPLIHRQEEVLHYSLRFRNGVRYRALIRDFDVWEYVQAATVTV